MVRMMSEKICLSDFITLQRGFDLPATLRRSGTVPVVASTGVSSWHNVAKVRAPGVVIGRSGSIGGGQYIEQDFWPLNTTLYVKDFKGNNPKYVFYVLRSIDFSAFNAGTGVPTLNRNHIASLEVNQKPRDIQDLIVSRLEPFDSAIANCRKQIALLEEAAMRLYREWFGDGKGEKKTIGEVCSKIGSGGTPNRRNEAFWQEGDVPWVKTGELQDCWIFDTEEKITADGLAGSSAKMFPAETVMMAIYASPTLGRLGILDAPACCNQATLCFLADETVVSWQWLYCKLFELREEFNAIASGAGQQNISGVVVKTYGIVVPAYDKIKTFTSIVSPMFSEARSLGRQIRSLTEARDRLLPKLMSGEVMV